MLIRFLTTYSFLHLLQFFVNKSVYPLSTPVNRLNHYVFEFIVDAMAVAFNVCVLFNLNQSWIYGLGANHVAIYTYSILNDHKSIGVLMCIHHIASIVLLIITIQQGLFSIVGIGLTLASTSTTFLSAVRISKALQFECTTLLFAVFAASFFVFRILLGSVYIFFPLLWEYTNENVYVLLSVKGIIGFLFVLHIIWFIKILQILCSKMNRA